MLQNFLFSLIKSKKWNNLSTEKLAKTNIPTALYPAKQLLSSRSCNFFLMAGLVPQMLCGYGFSSTVRMTAVFSRKNGPAAFSNFLKSELVSLSFHWKRGPQISSVPPSGFFSKLAQANLFQVSSGVIMQPKSKKSYSDLKASLELL